MTLRNNSFGIAEPESAKMADNRFETLNEEETAEIFRMNDKDSKEHTAGHEHRMFIILIASKIIVCWL